MAEVDLVDGIDTEDLFECADWALKMGIWDGRTITYKEAPDLFMQTERGILNLLFSEDTSLSGSQKLAATLAWIGTPSERRDLLLREIQELNFSSDDAMIIQTGFGKSVKKFWKKHKTEILIGAGIVAIGTVAVVITVCSGGTAAPAAAAAGGALISGLDKKEENPSLNKPPQFENVVPNPSFPVPDELPKIESTFPDRSLPSIETPPMPTLPSIPKLPQTEIPPKKSPFDSVPSNSGIPGGVIFDENGVTINNHSYTYMEMLQQANREAALSSIYSEKPLDSITSKNQAPPVHENKPPQSLPPTSNERWVANSFETFKRENQNTPQYKNKTSGYFHTEGIRKPHCRIGGINGISTSLDDAKSHAEYIKQFIPDFSVDWVHNQTHGIVTDLAEIPLNYAGISPNTAQLLQENWINFHEENKDNPKAKYFQICHSQGAIHVKNALLNSPKEIRDRIIVTAIAPAAIVPKGICYDSRNFISEDDWIPLGELLFYSSLDLNDEDRSEILRTIQEKYKEVIILKRHPEATGNLDHGFQSSTYRKELKDFIQDYYNRNGEYE